MRKNHPDNGSNQYSVSPSPASIASLSFSSTIIQGSESNYDGLNVAHLIAEEIVSYKFH